MLPIDESPRLTRLTVIAVLAAGIAYLSPEGVAAQELPRVTVTASDASASEVGPEPGSFVFERDGAVDATLTVLFTVGGTADSLDYQSLASQITFPVGAAAASLPLWPTVDALEEGDETVEVVLIDQASYDLGDPESATIVIGDDIACTPSDICKNQALIDAYEAGCEVLTDACNWSWETLSAACQNACYATEAAYDAVCNTTKTTCGILDGSCQALRDTVYDACLITGIGTGCNTQDASCRAGCAGECTKACAGPCILPWRDACKSCVHNCSVSCNSRCTSQLQACKRDNCPRDSGDSCFDCNVCQQTLELECQNCEQIAEHECDLVCNEVKPPCITEKQLGEPCTRLQCAEGLSCQPDLTGFDGMAPADLIETLLGNTNIEAALAELKATSGAGDMLDELGGVIRDGLCLSEEHGCKCSLPLLEVDDGGDDLTDILETSACVARYRPARHLQSWVVNQSIEGVKEGLLQRWRDGGIKEDLLEGFIESDQWQSLAFTYGGGAQAHALVGVVEEIGTVYGPQCYGCYYTVCGSAEFDLNAGLYATVGIYDATGNAPVAIKNLEGVSRVIELGASFPAIEAGASVDIVYPFPLQLDPPLTEADIGGDYWKEQVENWNKEVADKKWNDPETLLDQFIPAGRANVVSLGVGWNPVVANAGLCYTVVRDAICLRGPREGQQCVQTVPRLDALSGPEGNNPPVAECRDRFVIASDPPSCNAADVAVDWGSWDPEGSPLTLTQEPPGPYPMGTTTVTLTADDGEFTDSCQATVTVVDETAPELACPNDTVHECQGSQQAAVDIGEATAIDCSSVSVSNDGGGSYPLGTTVVEFTATDSAAPPNSSACSTQVTVEDTTSPTITCPLPQVVECSGAGQAPITFSASATDVCWGGATTGCVPTSGSAFPVGDTAVTCTAVDGSGNSGSCQATMTVADRLPPNIANVTATPALLWPPNHEMREIDIAVEVDDVCDPTPECGIVAVASDEPDDGDIQLVSPTSVLVRSERAGMGDGRVYTITVECRDSTGGNATQATTEVVVPHDMDNP